jgi:hypothetical protein
MSNPNQNLIHKDDDSSEEKSLKLKVFLLVGHKYILVVTTNKPNKMGAFSITAIGSSPVTFLQYISDISAGT